MLNHSKQRFFCRLVLLTLLVTQTPLEAGEVSVSSQGNRAQSGNPKIAVVELQGQGILSQETTSLSDQIRRELASQGSWWVLSKTDTGRSLHAAPHKTTLMAILQRAQEMNDRLEFAPAIQLLDNKLSAMQGMLPEESFCLVDAYILLGKLHHAEPQEALFSLREAVRLSPSLVLNEREYSPGVRKLFQQARDKVLADKENWLSLSVTSSPSGSKVYLNGILKGKTPLIINDVPPGRHYIALLKERYDSVLEIATIGKNKGLAIEAHLKKTDPRGIPAVLSLTEAGGQKKLLQGTIDASELLGVDRIILVRVEEGQEGKRATVERMDRAQPQLLSGQTVPFNSIHDRKAVKKLMASLEEAPVIGFEGLEENAKRKPPWKKPVFWVISGLIVAGISAGLGVAMSGQKSGGGSDSVISVQTPVPGLRKP